MAVELRCHKFYVQDDYVVTTVEVAAELARALFETEKSWPLDITDLETDERWELLFPESGGVILFQPTRSQRHEG